MRRYFVCFTVLAALGCGSDHGPEGTLVKSGPGVQGLPGGSEGVNASHAVPISGGTLLVLADGRTAVAADPDRDRVWLVNLDDERVTEVVLEPGDEPGRSVESIDAGGFRRVHVATRRGGALISINPDNGAIVDRRWVCPSPRGVAYDAKLGVVHVACQSGELVTLPAAGGAAIRSLSPLRDSNGTPVRDLRDVIVDGTRLLVSRFKTAELLVIGPDGQIAARRSPASGESVFGASAFEPSVAWRTVKLPSTSTRPNGGVAMMHQRSNPGQIAIGPSGYYSGAGPCSGAIVDGTVSPIDPDKPENQYEPRPVSFGVMVGPSDIAISADGSLAAIVSVGKAWTAPQGPTQLPLVVTTPRKLQIISTMPLAPVDPCATQPDEVPITGEPIAVAFAAKNRVVVQSREPAELQVVGGPTIRLSNDSRADTGIALFHMDSGFGIACASCHPEGMEDGRTWEFADIGKRRTQTVGGGLMATTPFHWSGDIENFAALMHEVFESRMGGARPNQRQIAAFSGWLDGVKAPPALLVDTASAERGRELFDGTQAACSSCHSGSHLTNNRAYNVGTGGEFQVPTLRGVGARAPFLHDGCAPTLRDRFGACGGGNQHGTDALTPSQVDDLVSYLETL